MNAPKESPLTLLSIVVIAKNEADRIPRLLASAGFADELIVVDSGSVDNTVELCMEAGARVVQHEWEGYARQKQFAVDLARGEWILSLDADEALSTQLAEEMRAAIALAPPDVSAFSMPRLSRYLNRWIGHGGWFPDRKVRLARRGCGRWVGDGIHERLEVSGRIGTLKNPILHYVYRDVSDQVNTINRFSSIASDNSDVSGTALGLLWGLVHAVGKFLECAIWKGGILDGIPGLIIAVNSSFYVFLKHAKAWEKRLPPDMVEDPQHDRQLNRYVAKTPPGPVSELRP